LFTFISYSILFSDKSKAIEWVKENGGMIDYEYISWLPKNIQNLKKEPIGIFLNETPQIKSSFHNISYLKTLKKLKILQLGSSKIDDLEGIENLSQIKELWLFNNAISDLSQLKNLSNLELLAIGNNPISKLEALKSLYSLKFLDIASTNITSIKPLSSLKNLEYLDISYTQIKDLEPLYKLPNLRQISIIDCDILKEELASFKKAKPKCLVIEIDDLAVDLESLSIKLHESITEVKTTDIISLSYSYRNKGDNKAKKALGIEQVFIGEYLIVDYRAPEIKPGEVIEVTRRVNLKEYEIPPGKYKLTFHIYALGEKTEEDNKITSEIEIVR